MPVSGLSTFSNRATTVPAPMEATPDPHNAALGQAIRKLRKEAGLTQQQLADRARVTVKELRLVELGRVNADWGTVRYLAYGMEMNLADVFRLAEELEPRDR
jgi:transcriptional regulator with XRE-family HTH domain